MRNLGPIRQKNPQKKVFFNKKMPHLVHSSAVTTARLVELRYELLSNQVHSSDLGPCDYFLFSILKKSPDRNFRRMRLSPPRRPTETFRKHIFQTG